MRSTDVLIDSLTADLLPVRRGAVAWRLSFGLVAGGMVTAALMFSLFGPRPDLMEAVHGPSIWMKWSYTLALALVAVATALRLARPERRGLRWLWLAVVPVAVVAALALGEMARAPARDWAALWLGHSWGACPPRVLLLSLPVFAGLLWAFRAFAPTRLRLAGAMAGFAAGAIGATLYGFACNETSALFLVTWYSLGIAGMTALGAVFGPRLLRW